MPICRAAARKNNTACEFPAMNFAAKLLPPSWLAAARLQVPIVYACLTLVSLSAVVSANLRVVLKREG